MSRDRVIDGLNRLQADGLACVVCGANYLHVAGPHMPGGRSRTGSQVFVCHPTCPNRPVANREPDAECGPGAPGDGDRPADGVR